MVWTQLNELRKLKVRCCNTNTTITTSPVYTGHASVSAKHKSLTIKLYRIES